MGADLIVCTEPSYMEGFFMLWALHRDFGFLVAPPDRDIYLYEECYKDYIVDINGSVDIFLY